MENCGLEALSALEPWCSTIYVDNNRSHYIDLEQSNTSFNLSERVLPYDNEKNNNILVEIDGTTITQQDFQIINQLAEIIQDSGEIGEFKVSNLKVTVIELKTYENNLIINEG